MTFNLFALCKIKKKLEVRKISITNPLQEKVLQIFEQQKIKFNENVKQIVPFTGDWKPDNDEIFEIDLPTDANIIIEALNANLTTIEELNLDNFEKEPIKALFGRNNSNEIMIQSFFKSQYLSRTFSIFLNNDTYNELNNPAISLDNKLLCYIANNKLRFKSFNNLRFVFDLSSLYKEATDEDIDKLCEYDNIEINNILNFKTNAGQNIRKRVHNILSSGVLKGYTAKQIKNIAKTQGLNSLITINNNKIVIPQDQQTINKLLSFFDEKLFVGPFSGNTIRANSTKIEE